MKTYQATIYIAGSEADALRHIRSRCYARGMCVTVTPTRFVYTGGEETGLAIGFIQYPRFPCSEESIFEAALVLARELITILNQKSASVVGTDRTEWISLLPPGVT